MTEDEPKEPLNAADLILGPTLARGEGDNVAILCGDVQMTFAALDATASRFGAALRPHLERGGRVLLLLRDSSDFVAAYLGVMRVGGVAVGLNSRLAARDLAFAIADSEADVCILEEDFVALLGEAVAIAGCQPSLIVVRGEAPAGATRLADLLAAAPATVESAPMAADDMAFWLYTSGTTGQPKAAIHSHGDVLAGDQYMAFFGLQAGERIFASSKLFFAFSLGHTLLGGLRSGATIILYEGWPDAQAIADVVERYRPTVMLSVPTFYRNLLREGFAKRPAFAEVRHYLSAGEALPVSLFERWLEDTGRPIVEGIGATETIFMMISGIPADFRPGATGKPMPYAEVRLLDENNRPVTESDAIGVLWAKLPSLCRGYWRQPDKTAAAFQDGWFRTGDTFSVDAEGWWYHHGRGDDLLKISGQWVSPGEIEECAASVPGVIEVAAVGVRNADDLVRVALFVVGEDGQDSDLADAVRAKLLSTLSVYKCPRNVTFIDAIPRTATGKIQRYKLRQMVAEQKATV